MSALAAEVLQACRAQGLSLATAESCTGGLVSGALTAVPGSSDVVMGGVVSYSNAAKIALLGVSDATLEAHGAVSEEVAGQMAEGAARALAAQIAVSTTGIAGPGGSEHKPEGRVCFGLTTPRGTITETVDFGAIGRDQVRAASVDHALGMVLDGLKRMVG